MSISQTIELLRYSGCSGEVMMYKIAVMNITQYGTQMHVQYVHGPRFI